MKNYLDFSGLSLYNDLVLLELTNFANEVLTSEDLDNILKYGQKEVIEASSVEGFPEEGDSDYIYVNTTTGDTYKWENNNYVLDNTLIDISALQSNWNESNTNSSQYILNKPTILTNNDILSLFDGGVVNPSGSLSFAYLGTSSGTAFSASFDPLTDTVWSKPLVLTTAQKALVKLNLGIDNINIEFNTTYNATTNKAATMADIPTVATLSVAGLMSSTDKIKLDNTKNITISSSEPTSSDGQNGDIWLVYDAS